MALNLIETAAVFQDELDKQLTEEATSGWMELNETLVKYEGGSEIKVPEIVMDGLADYDREQGFTLGSVSFKWKTYELTMDRGRSFTFDKHYVDETNFVLTAGRAMGEFQRTKVIPEIDSYRYSKISAGAIEKGKATGGYTATANTVYEKLLDDIAFVQDAIGDGTPLVITISRKVAALFDRNKDISRKIDVTDFTQGGITTKVKAVDDIPLIRVGSSRMKTAYLFKDGKTDGQTGGGFSVAPGAKSVNWIITPRRAPIAVSKTDEMRIFDPQTNQKGSGWLTDYRKFHDLWILNSQWDGVRVNIEEALS